MEGQGHGRWAVPDSWISVLEVVAGLSVVVVVAVEAVASVVAVVVGATGGTVGTVGASVVAVVVGGTVGTVVASVAAAAAVASVLLAVPGAPTVVGGDVGGAKGKCKIAASGRSGCPKAGRTAPRARQAAHGTDGAE